MAAETRRSDFADEGAWAIVWPHKSLQPAAPLEDLSILHGDLEGTARKGWFGDF